MCAHCAIALFCGRSSLKKSVSLRWLVDVLVFGCRLRLSVYGTADDGLNPCDRVGKCHLVKRQPLQYCEGIRGGGCALILAFLLLPYLVDVAYYGDLTPTHYAQENLESENDLTNTEKSVLCDDGREYSSVEANFTLLDAGTLCPTPAQAVFTSHYLFITSLTSRPPPSL